MNLLIYRSEGYDEQFGEIPKTPLSAIMHAGYDSEVAFDTNRVKIGRDDVAALEYQYPGSHTGELSK